MLRHFPAQLMQSVGRCHWARAPCSWVRAVAESLGASRRGSMAGMHGRGGGRAAGGKRAGPTIYELHSRGKRRSAREIPRLVAAGVAICWRAGRRELITLGLLELLSGVGVAAEVVVGRQVLQAFLLTGGAV